MEQHAIPRQITTFEFKLIGFMTLHQFLYLIIFAPLGYIAYMLFPIPILNIILAIAFGIAGLAFAFMKVNDRSLDVWVRNFINRINSPTQYVYHKNNPPISFFNSLFFVSDPHHVLAHVESEKMLSAYLAKTTQTAQSAQENPQRRAHIESALRMQHSPSAVIAPPLAPMTIPSVQKMEEPLSHSQGVAGNETTQQIPAPVVEKKPYVVGVVKNGKQIALPGILIYIKNSQNQPTRLLKTNQHGVFATFNPLPLGQYTVESKDPKNTYFFDTMNIAIQDSSQQNLTITSKEML